MIKYWMNTGGKTSQAGPYGEPMVDAFEDEYGVVREFTEYQVDCYQKVGMITETIYLNEEDWEFFMKIINNPPEPTEKLKALMARSNL